jgi:hypothetical protein
VVTGRSIVKRRNVNKRKPKQTPLVAVVDFLNDPPFDATESELSSNAKWFVEVSPETKNRHIKEALTAYNTVDALRPRLIELLAPVAEIPERSSTDDAKKRAAEKRIAQERRFKALCKLTWAINSQGLLIRFNVLPAKGGDWRVEQTVIPPNTSPEAIPTNLYDSLAAALVSGELDLLRRCPHCKRFFVALKDRRQRFCPGHMRLYYDHPSKATNRKKNWRKSQSEET